MDMNHKHTAKSSLRALIEAHGTAGTLALIGEVLREKLPARRGRPTRTEAFLRLSLTALGQAHAAIDAAESSLLELPKSEE